MQVLPIASIRSLLVTAVVLAFSATAARAHLVLDAPTGGEVLVVGSVYTITWHHADAHSPTNWGIWYSTTASNGPWTTIAFGLPPGDGEPGSQHTYDWMVPDEIDDTVWMMVWMNNPGYDEDFTVISESFSISLGCPADFDDDGTVGPIDLAYLLNSWGPCPDPDDCPAEFGGDGEVGPLDLATLLNSWGPCL